jgi:hypothetical protein
MAWQCEETRNSGTNPGSRDAGSLKAQAHCDRLSHGPDQTRTGQAEVRLSREVELLGAKHFGRQSSERYARDHPSAGVCDTLIREYETSASGSTTRSINIGRIYRCRSDAFKEIS